MNDDELEASYSEYVKQQGGIGGAAKTLALNYVRDIYAGQILDIDALDKIYDNALAICSRKLEEEKQYGSGLGMPMPKKSCNY